MDEEDKPEADQDLDARNTYMDYTLMTTTKNTEIRRKQTMNRRATIFAGDVDSLTDQFIDKKHTKTRNDLKRLEKLQIMQGIKVAKQTPHEVQVEN